MRANLLLWCIDYCNNPYLADEGAFSLVLDQLEDLVQKTGVTSESIADLSQSFGGETAFTVNRLLAPYRRLRMI